MFEKVCDCWQKVLGGVWVFASKYFCSAASKHTLKPLISSSVGVWKVTLEYQRVSELEKKKRGKMHFH